MSQPSTKVITNTKQLLQFNKSVDVEKENHGVINNPAHSKQVPPSQRAGSRVMRGKMCKTVQKATFLTINLFLVRFYELDPDENGGTLRVYDSQGKNLKSVFEFGGQHVFIDTRLRRNDRRRDIRDGLPPDYALPFAVIFGQNLKQLDIMVFWVKTEEEFQAWTSAFNQVGEPKEIGQSSEDGSPLIDYS